MKQFFRLSIASALLAPAAIYAASFEGKVSFTMKSGKDTLQNITYQIKGDKMRIELPNQNGKAGMIMDTTKKEMIVLMDDQKMYMTMAIPDVATKEVEKRQNDGKLEKTSETEKILGYTATKYISTSDGTTTDMWLAEGVGTFVGFNQNPMGGRRGANSGPQGWERALAGKELFPLRVVGKDKGGKESFRMEATAIEKQTLPDSLFIPPASYQKLDMGGMMKGIMQGVGR